MTRKFVKLALALMLGLGSTTAVSAQEARKDPNTDKWGVALNGAWLVSPEWDEIGPTVTGERFNFSDTYPATEMAFPVKKNGLWGFVNDKGKVSIAPKYQAIGTPSAWKESSSWGSYELPRQAIPVQLNGKWGFVGQNGKEKIKPEYDSVGDFYTESYTSGYEKKLKGNAMVQKGNSWFLIKHDGKKDSDVTYSDLITVGNTTIARNQVGDWVTLSGNRANVSDCGDFLIVVTSETVGYYGKKTKKFYTAYESDIVSDPDGKYGIMKDGVMTIEPEYEALGPVKGHAGLYFAKKEGKYGILDPKKGMTIPAKYDDIVEDAESEEIMVLAGGKWGLLDYSDNELIAPKYDKMSRFDKNYMVTLGGKAGVVDNSDAVILPIEYTSIRPYVQYCTFIEGNSGADDLLVLRNADGTYSIYSKSGGKVTLSGIQEMGQELYANGVKVKMNGKWGLLNKYGAISLPCNYTDLEKRDSDTNMVYIYGPNSIGLAKTNYCETAKVIVPLGHFDSVRNAYESKFVVGTKGNKIGAYCKDSGTLTPLVAGDDYFVYGDKIYFGPKNSNSGTLTCYNSKGKLIGTYNGGKAGVQGFLNRTMNK